MFLLSRQVGTLGHAKSEQAHHCAGMERESYPPTTECAREILSVELCDVPFRSQRVTLELLLSIHR